MLETGFPEGLVRDLMKMGHRVRWALDGEFGGYQGIVRNPATGVYAGASESRKDGQSAGY
jgi:gamma-glutamyltranspeptidase/glutathione hydrolase